MFSFLRPAPKFSEQDQIAHQEWVSHQYKTVVKPGQLKINNALSTIAQDICDDLRGFKLLLRGVCFHYLAMNLNNFFKTQGKQRARQFLEALYLTFTCEDILILLRQALQHGNYDDDSFKTVLHQRILEHYPQYKNTLCTEFLNDCWVDPNKFFNILFKKIQLIDRELPGLIL